MATTSNSCTNTMVSVKKYRDQLGEGTIEPRMVSDLFYVLEERPILPIEILMDKLKNAPLVPSSMEKRKAHTKLETLGIRGTRCSKGIMVLEWEKRRIAPKKKALTQADYRVAK